MAVIAFFQCGTCNTAKPGFRSRRIIAEVYNLFLPRADMLAKVAEGFALLPAITDVAWDTVHVLRWNSGTSSWDYLTATDRGDIQGAFWYANASGSEAVHEQGQIELIAAAEVTLKVVDCGANYIPNATIGGRPTTNGVLTLGGDDSLTSSTTTSEAASAIIDLIPAAANEYRFAEIASVPSGINVCP